ncbi:MAG: sulfate adenylyltransferase, partial [Pseudomonadota bacterium]
MQTLISPHGSDHLMPLLVSSNEANALRAQAKQENWPHLQMTSRECGDLIMLGIGGFTPLTGFMGSADWRGVCDKYALESGVFWPIPVTLSATEKLAKSLKPGQKVALTNPDGTVEILGILTFREAYTIDREHECQTIYKTTDAAHPGVKMVMQQEAYNLAGDIQVLSQGGFPEEYPGIYLTPKETRQKFKDLGWSRIAAFQTRNPMHRSHEYLAKLAIEFCDGVLIHSLLGQLKPGDIPADVRQEAIKELIDQYFVSGTVIQAGYPLDMRYAGPREALLHALFRQNYGCSHLIVGRDHAGVGDYYGPFEAQTIFDEIPENALAIQPLKIDWTFWCNKCDGM